MKRVKHFINTIVWALVGLYVVVVVMVNIPMAQSFIAHRLAQALSSKLGTPVSVGRVDVGLFNRLIVDDVSLVDQKGVPFFKATRLSVKVDYLEAMYGRVAITSAQVFGMKARLYRANADSPLNIQYVIDSLASKDTTGHKPLDLQQKCKSKGFFFPGSPQSGKHGGSGREAASALPATVRRRPCDLKADDSRALSQPAASPT